jgi:hypothetical protein
MITFVLLFNAVMRNRILSLALFMLAGIVIWGCKQGNGSAGEYLPGDVVTNPNTADGKADLSNLPVITFEEKEHDFGKIIDGESVSFEFRFTNTGKTDLVIADVSTSCGCTVPSYPKTAIRPGQSGSVKVSFNSRGRRGMQTKNIVVVANTQPNITQLKIKAQVVPPGND